MNHHDSDSVRAGFKPAPTAAPIPYPAYKDSGVPWLGTIPAHWEVKPLKHWVRINARTLPETTPSEYEFRYLDIGSVGTGFLTAQPQRLRFSDAPSRARRILQQGDTIVSTVRTYLKAVYFIDGDDKDFIASTGFAVLSPGQNVNPKYLSFLVQSDPFTNRVSADSVGIAYPAIAETKVSAFHVAMPTLDEQAAIVRYLDHADRRIRRYIAAKRRLIALLHEQKQAIIHRAVTRGLDPNARLKPSGVEWLGDVPEGWEIVALGMRYSVQLGKMLDAKRITGQSLVPYLRNIDVQWDRINIDNLPVMDVEPHEYERYTVKPGDMLVCEGGEVGRSAFWLGELSLCAFQKALHRVRPYRPEKDSSRFLYYIMYSASKLGVFLANGSENTIAHLTGEKLRRYRFPFPPIEDQREIAKYLDAELLQCDKTISRINREIDLIREYRTRLIADVVTGKLDVCAAAATLPDEQDAPESYADVTAEDELSADADAEAVESADDV